MNNKNSKIILHHHSLVYQEGDKVWFQSFFGAWVKELANHFSEVAILAESAATKTNQLDYLVQEPNVKIYSIGIKGTQSRAQRSKSIQKWGRELSSRYDYLLIRGITPRQYEVHTAFRKIPVRSFLMVGNLLDNIPRFGLSKMKMLLWFMHKLRFTQLRLISKKARVFANSPTVVNEFRDVLGIQSEFVPTNTISSKDFIPFRFKGFRQIPELLFCGRVIPAKGIEDLLNSVGELNNTNQPCKLKIIGGISDEYKRELDTLIAKLNIAKFISFEGFVKFGEPLLELYRAADIYVLSSFWQEGFPHTIWESSCSCTPVITTKIGGIPGVISAQEVMFVEPKSPAQITDAVKKLLVDPTKSEALVKNAYTLAQKYTVENCAAILKTKLMGSFTNV